MDFEEREDNGLGTNKSAKKQVRVYPRASKSRARTEVDTPEMGERNEDDTSVEPEGLTRTTRASLRIAREKTKTISETEIKEEITEIETVTRSRRSKNIESSEIENAVRNESDEVKQFQCETCPRTFQSIKGVRRHAPSCKGPLTLRNSIHTSDKNSSPSAESSASGSQSKNQSIFVIEMNKNNLKPAEDVANSMDESNEATIFDSRPSSVASSMDFSSNTEDQKPTQKDIGAIIKEIKQFTQVEVEAVEEGLCHCCGEDLSTAHTSGDYECIDCSKHFKFKSSYERHRRVIHNEGQTFDCPECGARCPDRGTLARHMYTHTGLKPYSCAVCGKTFSRKYHLVRHNMQTGCDGSEKPTFPCQVCGRVFNRKDNLREHLRAHAGQTKRKKSYSCEICNKEFFGTTLLHIHKRTHTGWERPYKCDLCEKRFPSSGAMKKHRRKHTGERPYECKECFARFAAKETLNRHIRTHNGLKPHECQFCGKRFIQATQLRAHIFHHSGENGFKCDQCNKSFNRRTRLTLHIKYVHEGAKPFTCDQCDKPFVRKEDLARHQILHTGVKAHKCPICEKCFAMKSSLKIHLLTHTKEPPRSCDECGRAFIRQDCLLRHMRTKHREMLEEIMAEAEKKKLQQQLITVADSNVYEQDPDEPASILSEETLAKSIKELLTLLVDETTLKAFGWPEASVDHVLESVIKRCGHEPAGYPDMPYSDKLRENAKLLFTVVIDDTVVKTLLNNQTVDEVILHVLRLAKS